MKSIIFISSFCGTQIFKYISQKSKKGLNVATQTFNGSLYRGLLQIGKRVKVLSYLPVSAYPGTRMLLIDRRLSSNRNDVDLIQFINLQYIKQLTIFFSALLKVVKTLMKRSFRESVILCDYMYLPICLPAIVVGRLFRKKAVLIIPDIPSLIINYMGHDKRISDWLVRDYLMILDRVIGFFDGYIVFGSETKNKLKLKKPTLRIEGIADISTQESFHYEPGEFILYAGSLFEEYGLLELIDSINFIDNPFMEIWICGAGALEDMIRRRSSENKRIRYLGLIERNEVMILQKKAKILVNPRKPSSEYTHYSFPSKVFEYLTSGRPVLMSKLEGIPDEYDPYYFKIEEVTAEGIADAINRVLKIPEKELLEKALLARNFVIQNKNPAIQATKVWEFVSSIK